MKKTLAIAAIMALCLMSSECLARGGFSSGGSRGGFSSGRSYSAPSRSYSAPSRSSAVTRTTTTTTNRSVGGGYYGGMGYHPMMYPGLGMGFGYSNGIMTGLIIGSLMHPQGTTVYQGSGYNGGSALLYPDGRVVDQNGYQVGTYINGQFTAVQGGMVAQQAPAGAVQQMQSQQPVPVVIDGSRSAWEIVGYITLAVIVVIIIFAIFV